MKSTIKLGLRTSVTIQPAPEKDAILMTFTEGFLTIPREVTEDQAGAIMFAMEQALEVLAARKLKLAA